MTDLVDEALMGFCHTTNGVAFICVDWAAIDAWLADPTAFQRVRLRDNYFPRAIGRYPRRPTVLRGRWATLPTPEAMALIAAGVATAI